MSDTAIGATSDRRVMSHEVERPRGVPQPVAEALGPGDGVTVGVSRLVHPPGADRDRLLLQRRSLQERMAGLLASAGGGRTLTNALFTDPRYRSAIPQSFKLAILTVIIAVPLGHPLRDRDRPLARASRQRAPTSRCCSSFVLPEIVIGVSMFLVFTYLLKISSTSGRPRR